MKFILATLLISISLNASDKDVLSFSRADLKNIKYLQSQRQIMISEAKNESYYPDNNLPSKKDEIMNSINSYSKDDFFNTYNNVLSFMEDKQAGKTIDTLKNEKIVSFLENNYKDMLKAIAYNESEFKHPVGLIDKDDVSYFQINIKQNIWNIDKLSKLTKYNNLSRNKLIDDYHLAGKVALHVLMYNVALYATTNNINNPQNTDLKKFIASYNHPYKLKEYYMASAENFLASL